MSLRKEPLGVGQIYHICSKSIAGFKIFNSHKSYERMLNEIIYYSIEEPPCKFSLFNIVKDRMGLQIDYSKKLVEIIAYCLMPTHLHLVLKQLKEGGISKFMKLILGSYSQYLNSKLERKGPLWEGRFKNVRVKNDDQLLHLTRYIHINPVTASLVDKPEDWEFSSYREYIGTNLTEKNICSFSDYLSIEPESYKKFVNDHIDYQKKLALIKHLTLE